MMLTCCWPLWILQKSKKCPIVIKAGLSPVSGNATWSPKEGVATATYFVRAFVMHNSSATVQYQVALGSSQGYFQVRMPCTSLCSLFAQHMLPVQATSAAAAGGQAPSLPGQVMSDPSCVLAHCLFSSAQVSVLLVDTVSCRLQVNGIDSRPKNMKIAAGICASVGPLMFLGYFVLQQLKKKKV